MRRLCQSAWCCPEHRTVIHMKTFVSPYLLCTIALHWIHISKCGWISKVSGRETRLTPPHATPHPPKPQWASPSYPIPQNKHKQLHIFQNFPQAIRQVTKYYFLPRVIQPYVKFPNYTCTSANHLTPYHHWLFCHKHTRRDVLVIAGSEVPLYKKPGWISRITHAGLAKKVRPTPCTNCTNPCTVCNWKHPPGRIP